MLHIKMADTVYADQEGAFHRQYKVIGYKENNKIQQGCTAAAGHITKSL